MQAPAFQLFWFLPLTISSATDIVFPAFFHNHAHTHVLASVALGGSLGLLVPAHAVPFVRPPGGLLGPIRLAQASPVRPVSHLTGGRPAPLRHSWSLVSKPHLARYQYCQCAGGTGGTWEGSVHLVHPHVPMPGTEWAGKPLWAQGTNFSPYSSLVFGAVPA